MFVALHAGQAALCFETPGTPGASHAGHVACCAASRAPAQSSSSIARLYVNCRYGHDTIVAMLKTHGATLGNERSSVECAAELCTCVSEGNLPLLR